MNIHEHPINLEVCPYKSRSTSLFLSPRANPDEYLVVIVKMLWDMGAGAAAFKNLSQGVGEMAQWVKVLAADT